MMWGEPLDQLGSGLVFTNQSSDVNAMASELAQSGWFVARCDCTQADDKATFINALATSMQFPEWTGRNWDALNDSLTDLGWIDSQSIAMVLDGVGSFRKTAPAEWQIARELIVEAADWWQEHEKTLIVIVA